MDYREVVDWFYDQVLDSIEISPFFFSCWRSNVWEEPLLKKISFFFNACAKDFFYILSWQR